MLATMTMMTEKVVVVKVVVFIFAGGTVFCFLFLSFPLTRGRKGFFNGIGVASLL